MNCKTLTKFLPIVLVVSWLSVANAQQLIEREIERGTGGSPEPEFPIGTCGEFHPVSCPEVDFPRCSKTLIEADVVDWMDTGIDPGKSDGVDETILKPVFEYPNCPDGLMESLPISMSNELEWKIKLLGTVASSGAKEKICFKNIPCGQAPFICTVDNPEACVNGISSIDSREILTHAAFCPKYAWCISAELQTPDFLVKNIILSWVTGSYNDPCNPPPDQPQATTRPRRRGAN